VRLTYDSGHNIAYPNVQHEHEAGHAAGRHAAGAAHRDVLSGRRSVGADPSVNGRWILLRTMSDRALFRAARTCTDRTGDSRTLWLGVSRHET
jgi:hypothetical protein